MNDVAMYRQELLGEFVGPTMEEKQALALQARYNIECDRFDDTFLTGHRHGESFPANYAEQRLMNDFSREELKKLRADAQMLSVSRMALRKAREVLLRYDRDEMEQTFERFKHTLEPDWHSSR